MNIDEDYKRKSNKEIIKETILMFVGMATMIFFLYLFVHFIDWLKADPFHIIK